MSKKKKQPQPKSDQVVCRALRCPVCYRRCRFWRRLRRLRWEPGELVPFVQRYHRPPCEGEHWPDTSQIPDYQAEWVAEYRLVAMLDDRLRPKVREALL